MLTGGKNIEKNIEKNMAYDARQRIATCQSEGKKKERLISFCTCTCIQKVNNMLTLNS